MDSGTPEPGRPQNLGHRVSAGCLQRVVTTKQRFVPALRPVLRRFRQTVSYPGCDFKKSVAALDVVGQSPANFFKFLRIFRSQRRQADARQNDAGRPFFLQKQDCAHARRTAD